MKVAALRFQSVHGDALRRGIAAGIAAGIAWGLAMGFGLPLLGLAQTGTICLSDIVVGTPLAAITGMAMFGPLAFWRHAEH